MVRQPVLSYVRQEERNEVDCVRLGARLTALLTAFSKLWHNFRCYSVNQ